jgi:hypothetical protein
MSTTVTATTPPAATHAAIARVLRDTAAMIRRDGWHQDTGTYQPYDGYTTLDAAEDAAYWRWNRDHCPDGVIRVYSGDRDDFKAACLTTFAGWLVLTGQADPCWCEWSPRGLIAGWNDAAGRTTAQVLAALSQAADVLEVVATLGQLETGAVA